MSTSIEAICLWGVEAANAFTPEWDELAARNPCATVFQTAGWYKAWLEVAADEEGVEPVVLCVSKDGILHMAVALQVHGASNRVIQPLSTPWADYHDAVGSPFDLEVQQALASAILRLMTDTGYSILCDDIAPNGILVKALRPFATIIEDSNLTASIDLTHQSHLEVILAHKEHRIKWRRLERQGEVHCRHHVRPDIIMERLPKFIALHRGQWEGRCDAVAPFDGHVIDQTFQAIVRHLAPRGQLLLTELSLEDQPIAMYFGFVYIGRYFGYRTTYDKTYWRLSPGHLMLKQMILDLAAAGFHDLDLMRGAYAYKREYCDKIRRNKCIQLIP